MFAKDVYLYLIVLVICVLAWPVNAQTKISNLPESGTIIGTDCTVLQRSSSNVKGCMTDIKTYMQDNLIISLSSGVSGQLPTANIADSAINTVKILDGTILDADINAAAAIALSKLATDPLARANHTGTQLFSTVTFSDTNKILCRDSAGSGPAEECNAAGGLEFGTGEIRRSALTGDVTASAGSNVTDIAAGVIVNADVNASAAIDATKIANGSVSNTEFQRLDGTAGALYNVGGTDVAVADGGTGASTKLGAADNLGFKQEYCWAASDQTTDLSTGTGKVVAYLPNAAATVSYVRAYTNTAPTGSTIIIDINEAGTTLMSATKLSIDASEKTSETAATAAVLSDTSIAANAEITVDIDQVGSTITGKGLVVCMGVTF